MTLYMVESTNEHGARVTTHRHTPEAAVKESLHRMFGLGHTQIVMMPDRNEEIDVTPESGLLQAIRQSAKPRQAPKVVAR